MMMKKTADEAALDRSFCSQQLGAPWGQRLPVDGTPMEPRSERCAVWAGATEILHTSLSSAPRSPLSLIAPRIVVS